MVGEGKQETGLQSKASCWHFILLARSIGNIEVSVRGILAIRGWVSPFKKSIYC